MTIFDNINLLYCLNEAGANKAYKVLTSILQNEEYAKMTPEQLEQEFKEQRREEEEKRAKNEEARKAELQSLKDKYKLELKMIGDQNDFYEQSYMLEIIEKVAEGGTFWKLVHAFNWGYIQGKRAERARRKKVQHV